MKVSELANAVAINPQTVRYYEREGLLDKPERNSSGYREYDQGALVRLRFICEAKETGFTLREIRELMGLDTKEPQSCSCVQAIVETKLKNIEEKLRAMLRLKKLLKRLHERCIESDSEDPCPVLGIPES